jgi:hypothetical protein
MSAHTETYVAPPSALHYMLQAFRPSSGWMARRFAIASPDDALA